MKTFFPMRRDEGLVLAVLVTLAAVAFLPVWRTIEFAGMAAFGWFMAALMILTPALALYVFLRNSGHGKCHKR